MFTFLKKPEFRKSSIVHPSLFSAWHGHGNTGKKKSKKLFIIFSFALILGLAGSFLYPFYRQKALVHADSLIKFDEGFGTSVNDANSSVSAGTITNAVWKAEELCQSGKCLFFDGTQDYVSFADDADLDFAAADSFSVSFWFRHVPKTSGTEVMVVKLEAVGTDGGYQIQMEADGDITCQIEDDDADTTIDDSISSTAATYDDNRWHYVSCVKSGTASLTLYIDAVQITQDAALNGSGTLANDDTFYIGIDGDGTSNDYTGFIDEVKVYRSARTASEVKADMAGTTPDRGTAASFGPDTSSLSQGLVGYWKMDDAAVDAEGETSTDSSGNGNTGTLYGDNSVGDNGTGLDCTASGKFGTGCNLDGTDDYVEITDSTSLNATSAFTISAWVNMDTFPNTDNRIVDKTNSSLGFALLVRSTGQPRLMIGDGSTYRDPSISSLNITAGSWYHLAGTYSNGIMKVFVNGSETGSSNLYTYGGPATGKTLRIGTRTTEFIDGKTDDVRVYNRALSPAEISSLYSWAPGPVGEWKMDENTGTGANAVKDTSGNNNHGGMEASMTNSDWVPGKLGSALDFDGTDDYVTISDSDNYSLSTAGKLSVSFWYYPRDLSDALYLVNKRAGSNFEWDVRTGTSGAIRAFILQSDNTIYLEATSASGVLTVNQWHHIEFIADSASPFLRLYVNGVLVAEDTTSSGSIINGTAAVLIAKDGSGSTYTNSIIDDLKIYNYTRTPGQIIEDMNAGHPAPGSPIGSAVGHWKFDEGYLTTAYDNSVNANNLTLSTASWTNSGKFGKAFNGLTNVRASRDDDADLDFAATDDLSFSVWFKSDSTTNPSANEYLLEKGGNIATDAIGYAIYTSAASDGLICFGIDDDAISFPEDSVCSTSDLYDNTWHHILAEKTGTSRLDLYVDGKPNGTPDTAISATGTLANSAVFYLGDTNATDGTDEFLGDIDEVKIFRSALTAAQIKALYNQSSSAVWGALSTNASGTADNSSERSYCPPGDTTATCSPIAEWKMDENTGTSSTYDTSGNGNTGTLNGSMTADDWVPGKVGSALDFDGSDDHITAGSSSFDPSATDFTLSVWAYPRSTALESADTRVILAQKYGTGTGRKWLQITNSTTTWGSFLGGATQNSGSTVNLNVWTHVVLVHNNSANTLSWYIDGVPANTNSSVVVESANGDYVIGANRLTTAGRFDGRIDDLRIYNYARTPAQVAWDYNRGKPIGWWKFDECTDATAYDSGSNTYTGTITPGDATGDNDTVGTCSSGTTTEMWNDGTNGKRNASLGFDGTNDYVSISDNANLRFDATTADFSLFAWVKRAVSGANHTVVAKEEADNDGWRLLLTSGNTVQCSVAAVDVTSSSTITDTNWHYVGCTIDRDGNGQTYIDGRADGTATAISSTAMATTSTVRIGTNSIGTPTNYFSGQIDDVKIFNYALTAQQIKSLFNGGAVSFIPITGSP